MYSFTLEKYAFHLPPSLKPAKIAVRPNRAVTGDDNGKRVMRKCAPDGAGALRTPKMLRDPSVGAHEPARNLGLGEQDPLLKGRTVIEGGCVEIEEDGFSFKKSEDPLRD